MVIAGIVAGGTGSRMSKAYSENINNGDVARGGCHMSQMGNLPKQFMEVGGKPILLHTIEKFLTSPDIDAVVVGVHPDWKKYSEDLIERFCGREILIIAGGGDRTDTLNRIVEAAAVQWRLSDEDIFVTHDAVRPFVTQEIIHENVLAAQAYRACGTAIAATDTILRSCDGEFIEDIPLRSQMYQAQTPQSFQYGIYREVYGSFSKEELGSLTDACGMFYRKGRKVYMVKGNVRNFKITYPQDLQLAEALVK